MSDGKIIDLGIVTGFAVQMQPSVMRRGYFRVEYRPTDGKPAAFDGLSYKDACDKVAECCIFVAEAMVKAKHELPPKGRGIIN